MGKVDNNKHIVNSSDGKSGRSGINKNKNTKQI